MPWEVGVGAGGEPSDQSGLGIKTSRHQRLCVCVSENGQRKKAPKTTSMSACLSMGRPVCLTLCFSFLWPPDKCGSVFDLCGANSRGGYGLRFAPAQDNAETSTSRPWILQDKGAIEIELGTGRFPRREQRGKRGTWNVGRGTWVE